MLQPVDLFSEAIQPRQEDSVEEEGSAPIKPKAHHSVATQSLHSVDQLQVLVVARSLVGIRALLEALEGEVGLATRQTPVADSEATLAEVSHIVKVLRQEQEAMVASSGTLLERTVLFCQRTP